MGDVIKFPPIADRSWIELERDLRKILVTGGATSEQADAILNRMTYDFSQPVGESIPVSPPFPDSVSAAERDAIMDYISSRVQQGFQKILYGQVLRGILTRQAELYLEFIRFYGRLP